MSNQTVASGWLSNECTAPALSAECTNSFGHHLCVHHEAAWDFVLDRPTECLCACHGVPQVMSGACQDSAHRSCPQQGQAWEQPADLPACSCRCHLAAHLISVECQDMGTHRVCLEYEMAWDLLRDVPADCLCRCHA